MRSLAVLKNFDRLTVSYFYCIVRHMRIPEFVFLVSQAAAEEVQSPAVEDAISTYNLRYASYADPKIEVADCLVDTSEYPNVELYWPKKGPNYGAQEEGIVVSQQTGDAEDIAYKRLNDFEVEIENSYRFVDLVFALDTSGSMGDNSELVRKIEKQIASKVPDPKVPKPKIRIWTINYDNGVSAPIRLEAKKSEPEPIIRGRRSRVRQEEIPAIAEPMVFRQRRTRDDAVVETSEEDHLGALREGIQFLKKESTRDKTKKYVILVTDEGQRRYRSGEESKVAREAKKAGVEIHLLYSKDNGGGWGWNDNFTSLINLAVSSGGSAVQMERGKIPNVFNTGFTNSNFVSIDFEDTNPYEAGERTWTVSNGEGAICKSEVSQEMIENAIAQGRLEVPKEIENEKEAKDILPLIVKITAAFTAIVGVGLALLNRKERNTK
jgi:hypothetical protein